MVNESNRSNIPLDISCIPSPPHCIPATGSVHPNIGRNGMSNFLRQITRRSLTQSTKNRTADWSYRCMWLVSIATTFSRHIGQTSDTLARSPILHFLSNVLMLDVYFNCKIPSQEHERKKTKKNQTRSTRQHACFITDLKKIWGDLLSLTFRSKAKF